MRKLHELYEILSNNSDLSLFICNRIQRLYEYSYLTLEEKERLYNHFISQKPTKILHSEFYNHRTYHKFTDVGMAWWPYYLKDQRDLFIKKMIQITKQENI